MKATIRAISTKNNSILLSYGDTEKWYPVEPPAMAYAAKGDADITLAEDGKTVKLIKGISNTNTIAYPKKDERQGFSSKFERTHFPLPSYSAEREKKIIRQSCLKAAVDYISGIPYEKRNSLVIDIAKSFEDWVNREKDG